MHFELAQKNPRMILIGKDKKEEEPLNIKHSIKRI